MCSQNVQGVNEHIQGVNEHIQGFRLGALNFIGQKRHSHALKKI
jgi:hypothetical protein